MPRANRPSKFVHISSTSETLISRESHAQQGFIIKVAKFRNVFIEQRVIYFHFDRCVASEAEEVIDWHVLSN